MRQIYFLKKSKQNPYEENRLTSLKQSVGLAAGVPQRGSPLQSLQLAAGVTLIGENKRNFNYPPLPLY